MNAKEQFARKYLDTGPDERPIPKNAKTLVELFGQKWPDTGRTCHRWALVSVHHIHPKWLDLVWWDKGKQLWMYLSTIPWSKELSDLTGRLGMMP